MTPEQKRAVALAAARKRLAAKETNAARGPERKMGAVLPVSADETGWQFDSNAGVVGAVKRAAMLPGDVASGEVPRMVPLYPEEVGKSELGAIMVRNPEYYDRAMETAAISTPVNPMVRSGVKIVPGTTHNLRVRPPTGEELRRAGSDGFDQGRALGVEFSPAAVNKMADVARAALEQKGFAQDNAPQSFNVLDALLKTPPPGFTASYNDLLRARARLKRARENFNNPSDKSAAEFLVRRIDDFVRGPDAASVVAGPASKLGKIHDEALGNYSASYRARDIGALEQNAIRRAKASNSGKNIGNTLRQRAASILENPKKTKGFTAEEIAALEKVATGTATQNLLRDVGNLLGGGGGLGNFVSGGAAGTLGYAVGGWPGAAALGGTAFLAGRGAKWASNRSTLNALRKVDEMSRKRSPLYARMKREGPMTAANPNKEAALIKLLIATGLVSAE